VPSSGGSSEGLKVKAARSEAPGKRANVALWIEQLDGEYERATSSVGIPSSPELLLQLGTEAHKDSPDLQRVVRLVTRDVGLSAALIKLVNSPFYGLKHKVGTVKQAVSLLGLLKLSRTVAGLVLKNTLSSENAAAMQQFWEASSLVAEAAARIAAATSSVSPDQAYTFGLFRDCGIALLMRKFPAYSDTLGVAGRDSTRDSTAEEQQAFGTDHATVGALLARAWRLPEALYLAIRFHHDYPTLSETPRQLPPRSLELVALGVLADRAVQGKRGRNASAEWQQGGAAALDFLGLTQQEGEELFEQLEA
jgi:HD-like signal output (HDOD) protein